MTPEILQEIDYDEWKKFLKYSIDTTEYDNIMELAQMENLKISGLHFRRLKVLLMMIKD